MGKTILCVSMVACGALVGWSLAAPGMFGWVCCVAAVVWMLGD